MSVISVYIISTLYHANGIRLIAILAQISVDLKHRVRCTSRHVARFLVSTADCWLLGRRTADASTNRICDHTERAGYLLDGSQMLLRVRANPRERHLREVDACFGSDLLNVHHMVCDRSDMRFILDHMICK